MQHFNHSKEPCWPDEGNLATNIRLHGRNDLASDSGRLLWVKLGE
jgi:hypothetical protein